jgi:prepilin-type N-terminal cleavage/methylation domain-containing protein
MIRGRGFTLIEVLISMAISLVGIAAALAVLATQNASFTRQAGLGSAVTESQFALDALENAVRMAGTGIDPQMGFDFDFYKCVLPGGALSMTDSAGCTTATRDSASQPDEMVVAYRDPAYATSAPADARAGCNAGNASTFIGKVWGVTAATASSVTLVLKPGDTIYRGQVLQIVCNDGITYTYGTVSSAKSAVASSAVACSATTLNLYTAGINVRDPFNQPGVLTNGCFSTGGANSARAYAVRRNRFFIRRDLSNPAQPQPYLMLDQGLDLNDDGTLTDADLVPLAVDVLDMQVAYSTEQPGIMALATAPTGWVKATYVTDSNTNGIWGDDPGNAEQLTEPVYTGAGNTPTAQFNAANTALYSGVNQSCTGYAGVTFYQYPCLFGTSPVETSHLNNIHAYRWTAWPGNISQVQIAVVGMGAVIEEVSQQSLDEMNMTALLNRSALSAPTYNAWYLSLLPKGRKRVIVQTAVRPTNMALASLFWN